MRRILGIALLLVLAALALHLVRRPGRVVYRGGPILTLDPADRIAEALGTNGDRIAVVGDEDEVMGWAGSRARIVELDGRALLPGFIDAHGHFPGAGLYDLRANLSAPPVGDVERMDELVARMREEAARTGAGEWVVGLGYDDTLLRERRHPTRNDLDRASDEHPLAILHVSGHLAVVNTRGLEAIGIGADSPDPEGGRIRRDAASGAPDGVLEETAMDPLQSLILEPGPFDGLRIVRRASELYLAQGVTTAQSGYADPGQARALTWLSRLGLLPLRVIVWPGDEWAEIVFDGGYAPATADDAWVRRGAVKIVADGSIQGYTGYLSEPYHVPPGDDPGYRGYPRVAREDLMERVARYHDAGLQIAVHGNGDASIDDILDAFEAAQRRSPRPDARHIVIHAQMTREDQLDRMAALGVIPSFFSLHTFYWGDRHREIFMGPERAARMSPARSALDRGMHFTIHADAPVVPMEPLRLVWSAVNRLSRSGVVVGPEQRLSVLDALHAVTRDAAYQHFEERDKGTLEPGKLADLVILDRSPLDDPATIDRIRVVETVIAGRSVYRADDAP